MKPHIYLGDESGLPYWVSIADGVAYFIGNRTGFSFIAGLHSLRSPLPFFLHPQSEIEHTGYI